MSPNVADGAVLVAAAIQATIQNSGSVRMVSAVAAAVAGKVLQHQSAAAQPTRLVTKPRVLTQDAPMTTEADNPDQLLASLRAARRAQRQRKKQRRREAKQAARNSQDLSTEAQHFAEPSLHSGTAGLRAEHVGVSAAVPAPVPESSSAAASTRQPCGLPLQHVESHDGLASCLGLSDNDLASNATSAGMIRQSRAASDFRHSPYSGGNPSAGGQ